MGSYISRTKTDNHYVDLDITSIPGFSFKLNKYCDFVNDKECCICFIEYYNGIDLHMLPCNHIIHKECIMEWYKKSMSCPLCRN
jgi:hypothetical protein